MRRYRDDEPPQGVNDFDAALHSSKTAVDEQTVRTCQKCGIEITGVYYCPDCVAILDKAQTEKDKAIAERTAISCFDLSNIFNHIDDEGNKLSCSREGKLRLKLAEETTYRMVGVVGRRGGIIKYIKSVKEKNRHRKSNSWGICWAVLSRMPDDGEIIFHSTEAIYSISVARARGKGQFLFFKRSGFEKQFFVPIKCFTIEKL